MHTSFVDRIDQVQMLFLVLQTSLVNNLEGRTLEYECSGNVFNIYQNINPTNYGFILHSEQKKNSSLVCFFRFPNNYHMLNG